MDAITMLKDDHRNVEKLFKRFEQAGDRAFVEKRKIVDRIIEELSVHAAIEEQLFYPVTRATVPAVEDDALESLEEHHIVKWVLSELEDMDPEDERFDAKVTVLIENVRHHVEEEESEYFREVRDELGRKALTELGDAMATAREMAPTRPHPRMPDTPPGNVVVGAAAGMADRVGATVSGIAQGGVAVVQDVADRVRGRDRRRPSPTGPRRARVTATSVRAGSDDALERAIAAVREAKAGGERVAGAAVREAKAGGEKVAGTAARQARSGGEKVAREARSGATRTAKAATTPAGKRAPRTS
ncbi:MAG TPA: hemerythrin domain-containing protein [Actinomycetospora sp.]|nr:hemerythrin domain-containing protein [Actinomycetospora sp.]